VKLRFKVLIFLGLTICLAWATQQWKSYKTRRQEAPLLKLINRVGGLQEDWENSDYLFEPWQKNQAKHLAEELRAGLHRAPVSLWGQIQDTAKRAEELSV